MTQKIQTPATTVLVGRDFDAVQGDRLLIVDGVCLGLFDRDKHPFLTSPQETAFEPEQQIYADYDKYSRQWNTTANLVPKRKPRTKTIQAKILVLLSTRKKPFSAKEIAERLSLRLNSVHAQIAQSCCKGEILRTKPEHSRNQTYLLAPQVQV